MERPRSSPRDWRRPRPTETAPAPRWRRYLRFPPAAGSTAAGLQRPATDECPDWTDWPWRLLPRHVPPRPAASRQRPRSEEHTSELQSHLNLVCRLLLEKKKNSNTCASRASLALESATYSLFFFFFNDRAPTEIYPLPPHAALPISFPAGCWINCGRTAAPCD